MTNIFGLTATEISEVLAPWDVPAYKGKQIAAWLYKRGVVSWDEMTDLTKNLRQTLGEALSIETATLLKRQDSVDGRTTKFLLSFADGTAVETVLMRQPYGHSVCLSTQAGCDMGCAFCASTLYGRDRDLTGGEIMAEAVFVNNLLRAAGNKIDTIVIMGMGEPLANYDNVLKFIRLAHEPYALNLSYRGFTLSTAGLVPLIYRLAEEGLPLNLSISLHAPNDELRSKIMPINKKYHLNEVVKAGRNYAERTGRRVTYEYILIADLNDDEVHAEELTRLLRGELASVNLIPINPVAERGFKRPTPERVQRFLKVLTAGHITATVRREMGGDIAAACGQLRRREIAKAKM